MTETNALEEFGKSEDTGGVLKITYILYIAGLVFPILSLAGLIMAYINRGDAPAWAVSHYRWLIRTFWIDLLWVALGTLTVLIKIGFLVLFLAFFWYIVRVIRGFSLSLKKRPILKETSWGL